jgi:predicted extracellular nuclease
MNRIFALCGVVVGLCIVAAPQAAQYPPGPGGACTDTLTLHDIRVQPAGACHPASGDSVYGVRGVCIGFDKIATAYTFYIQQAGSGPGGTGSWQGAEVFTGTTNYFDPVPGSPSGGNLQLGDQIVFYGRLTEFNGRTRLTDFDNTQSTDDLIIRRDTPASVALPPFYVGDVHQFNWVPSISGNLAEQWEGMLVKLRGPLSVVRTAGTGVGTRAMLIGSSSFPADTAAIDGFSLSNIPALPVGTVIDSVQGILTQTIIAGVPSYRILMRDSGDLFFDQTQSVRHESLGSLKARYR